MNNADTFANEFNRNNVEFESNLDFEETESDREEYSRELFKREIRRLMHKAVSSERHEALSGLIDAYSAVKIREEDEHEDAYDRYTLSVDRDLRL